MFRYKKRIKRVSSSGFNRLYLSSKGLKNVRRSSLFGKRISRSKYAKKYPKNIIRADRIDYSDWKLNKK